MLIFQDIFNTDEFMSDIFPFTLEYDDCIMKVQSSYKAPEDVGNVDIGCGNAFGGGEEEQEILEVLKIYEKEHPENIGKLLYKNTNHRHQ